MIISIMGIAFALHVAETGTIYGHPSSVRGD